MALPFVHHFMLDLNRYIRVKRPNAHPHGDIDAQAAVWLARHQLGTIDEDAFAAWRSADPRHALAFVRALAAWEAADQNIPAARPAMSRRAMIRGAAVACGLAFASAGSFVTQAYAWESASTVLGESRKIHLPDGSMAALNTSSRLSWRCSATERTFWVESGEVALNLVAGPPAVLHGEAHVAQLSPGRFNARLRDDTLDLLVLRGQAREGAVLATDGHSLWMAQDAALVRPASAMQVASTIAWQQGEILLQDVPLGTAVEEYNRYLERKIVIVDADLASIRVGGRFTSANPDTFLQAVSVGLGVHVSTSASGYFLTR